MWLLKLCSLVLLALPMFAEVQVFVFLRPDCPPADRAAPELRKIAEGLQGKHVAFYLVYPNPDENKRALENHMAEFQLPGTPLRDPDRVLVKRSHATTAPEVAVFDSAGNLKYRGGIAELKDAISAVLLGKPVAKAETRASGCV